MEKVNLCRVNPCRIFLFNNENDLIFEKWGCSDQISKRRKLQTQAFFFETPGIMMNGW